jgi:hypothetical protein
MECLQQDEAFISATFFCEQCFHACRILREEHMPRVSLEFIGRVYGVERGTIYNNRREYKTRPSEAKHAGGPPALSSQELDEITAGIRQASSNGGG